MRLLEKIQESRGRGSSSAKAARRIVPWLITKFQPTTVIDVGCGDFAFGAEFLRYGVKAKGFDLAPRHVQTEKIDLTKNYTLPEADLALCLEAAEHIPQDAGRLLVSSLTSVAPVVVFSAAIPMQGGSHHVNEQWQSYWAAIFAEHGYASYVDLRNEIWGAGLAPWYPQNVILYCKTSTAVELDLTYSLHINVVHPDMWERIGPMGWWQRMKHLTDFRPP